MDLVDDPVRPELPVTGGPYMMRVPRCSFQARPTSGKRLELELPLAGYEISVQVGRVDVLVKRQLPHG
jgi:hypothetical protein